VHIDVQSVKCIIINVLPLYCAIIIILSPKDFLQIGKMRSTMGETSPCILYSPMPISSTDVKYKADGNSRRFYAWKKQEHSDLDEHIALLLIEPKHVCRRKIQIMNNGWPQCISFLIRLVGTRPAVAIGINSPIILSSTEDPY
jgi:hypothetical protein